MSRIQNKSTRNAEKPFPGCLGRVVNFFDLGAAVTGNRLLTDRPYLDGSRLSRGQSDATRISPIGDAFDEKVVASELTGSSSTRRYSGTPMKMLMAQEMTKEEELKHNSPTLVAKLMGLDAIPHTRPDSAAKRTLSRSHSGSNSGIRLDYLQREHGLSATQPNTHQSLEQNGRIELSDKRRQSRKECHTRNKPRELCKRVEGSNDSKMALVRQKFVEAKRLATNEKHRQSKQFHEALEVLSSNRGLLLKLLQEPNSTISQTLRDLQSVSPSPETKRITVLRPSKMLDDNQIPGSGKINAKPAIKSSNASQVNRLEKRNHAFSPSSCRLNENLSQPTQIVVLKPTGKPRDLDTVVSPPSPPSRVFYGKESYGERVDYNMLDMREVAKETTHQMGENLRGPERDQTMDSSVFCNGYIGDESSFHKSEDEYAFEDISDSEAISPTSRHSWDYIRRFEGPFSSSSFSRASCSPESPVCREAKKRLSERWALMSYTGLRQEQKHIRKNSSTLGEMLALPDPKNPMKDEERGRITEQELRGSPSCSSSNLYVENIVNDSPRSLFRSKSLPSSSTAFLDSLNGILDPEVEKNDTSKEVPKTSTNSKSSFKVKIASLFFSRNKKSSKDNFSASQSKHESEKPVGTLVHASEEIAKETSVGSYTIGLDSLRVTQESQNKIPSHDLVGMDKKQVLNSPETKLSLSKPTAPVNLSENQEQPSPISVLEPPFEEDESIATDSSNVEADKYAVKLLPGSLKASHIDKSPPIESIFRTLSWDDNCADTAISYPLKPLRLSQGTEEEEQELLFFIKSLLLAAGLDGQVGPESFSSKWHSPESPLDPSLRENYVHFNDKELVHDVKRKQRRSSTIKLVFDCVNTALVEITSDWIDEFCSGTYKNVLLGCGPSSLVDAVWFRLKDWFPIKVPDDLLGDDVDSIFVVVDVMVRKDFAGNGWTGNLRSERDYVGKEIEVQLLDELVQELLVDIL